MHSAIKFILILYNIYQAGYNSGRNRMAFNKINMLFYKTKAIGVTNI